MTYLESIELRKLRQDYECLCERYRQKLCKMWDIWHEDTWWIADRVGGSLMLCDCCVPLDMPMIRYVVENNIPESDFIQYCDFVDSEIFAGRDIPRINFYSWTKGMRPEMLTD